MTEFIFGGPERYKHQRRGLNKIIRTGGVCALLFDPGTGKTAVTLDYASMLALKVPGGEARVLVVCPLAAVDTWVMQAGTYVSPQVRYWAEALGGSITNRGEALASRGGQPFTQKKASKSRGEASRALHYDKALAWEARGPGDRERPITASEGPDALGDGPGRLVLEVINLDTLMSRALADYGRGTKADFLLESVRRFNPHLIVVDESHKIKSATANASRLLARMSSSAPRRIILTGTVMPHSPLDVFGQWRFLEPYAFGPVNPDGTHRAATWSQFRGRYAVMGGFMGREVKDYVNLDEMQDIIAKNSEVALKEEALDLPATTDVIVPVNLSPAESKAYREMKDLLAAQLASGQMSTVPNRLTQMLRLRQITSGHLPDDSGSLNIIGRSKADVIKSIVHDTLVGEKRIVIFCLFSQEIAMLSSVLSKSGTEVMVIEGSTSTDDRKAMRKRFGSDDPARIVMIAQIKTMSLAVNELVTANHAIFGSLSQQRDDLIQARDRLNRIGQTRPVTFWYAVAPGTVDQVILEAHDKRTNLESAMLKHIQGS